MSVNEANLPELDLLRQRITELEAELEKKNVELEEWRLSVDHLMKQINELRDENIKRDTENAELKVRVVKLEQGSSVEQPQNERFKSQAVDVPNTVVDQPDDAKLEQDSSVVAEQSQDAEDGKVFLLRGGFKKLQRESTAPEMPSVSLNVKEATFSTEDDAMDAFLIEQHKKSIAGPRGDKSGAAEGAFSKSSEEIRQGNREKKLQRESTALSVSQNTASVTSHERKNEQGLIQEINSSMKEKHAPHLLAVAGISANQVRPNNETSLERNEEQSLPPDIISLYETACGAEKKAIEANREETLRWCFYAREFKRMYKDFMVSNKVGEKKAKGQVYDFIIKQLPDTKRKTLCRQTQKALRIDDLFEKIGMDKLQYIKTYSADTISKFTNSQIQTIIDHFTERPNLDFTDDYDNSTDSEEVSEATVSTHVHVKTADYEPKVEPVVDDYDDDAFAESFRKDYEKMLEDKRIPKVSSKDETLASSSNSDSDSVSDSDSDYDESMEQLHDELTREEMARLKALEVIAGGATSKITPPIKIFDDLKLLDDDLFPDEPVDSNHPINARSEGITAQA